MESYDAKSSYSVLQIQGTSVLSRAVLVACCGLTVGCTRDVPEQQVRLVFPGEAVVEATREVRWRLYRGGDEAICAALLRGEQAGTALELQLDARLPFPFQDDDLLASRLADGRYTFFVEAYRTVAAQPFLSGCLTIDLSAGESKIIRVALTPPGQCSGAGCVDAALPLADTTTDDASIAADAAVETDSALDSRVADSAPDDEASVSRDAEPARPDVDAASPAPDAAVGPCEEEWCDGKDNDCDGVRDNGEVCSDPTVENTEVFDRSVYLLGSSSPGSCSADALQAFWPSLSAAYRSGFDCYARRYRFRRDADTLYYFATFSGIRLDDQNSDPVVATPPCGDRVDELFDFDGSGTLHYRCEDSIRRGNGELVALMVKELVVVLDDGRSVAIRSSSTAARRDDFVVLDGTGQELARLGPHAQYVGTLEPDPGAATVKGNNAYLTFRRTYGQEQKELVVYRIYPDSSWRRVRRLPVQTFGSAHLAISDGTVFVREQDPLSSPDDRIVAYLPNGTMEVVWREADAATVRSHGDSQLLVGPR